MKLETEFYRLPLEFDAERLRAEVTAFDEEEWRPHPQGFEGNSAMILVAANGGINDDMQGVMLPTEKLRRCPYIRQVLAAFDTVVGRSRLMRLAPQSNVSKHCDINYYWNDRVRVHVPIVTDPRIRFWCNDKEVHMAAGDAWIFDNWREHMVINPTEVTRIHLVFDTTGSSAFWELVAGAERPFDAAPRAPRESRSIAYRPSEEVALSTERVNAPVVMHPAELDACLLDIAEELRASEPSTSERSRRFLDILERLRREWRSAWSLFGAEQGGWPSYRALVDSALREMDGIPEDIRIITNNQSAKAVLRSRIEAAFNAGNAPVDWGAPRAASPVGRLAAPVDSNTLSFARPVIIVSAPRAGSTLLFETLATNRDFWTVGGESHLEFESIASLDPGNSGYHSNRLTAIDATPEVTRSLLRSFAAKLRDSDGVGYLETPAELRPSFVRFLEKTPKNALRIPFLDGVFPDASFIFLHRNARENISAIIDAWRAGRHVTYPGLPGWNGPPWSMLLPPGWRALNGAPIERIAAFQWRITNQQILDDLAELPPERWCAVGYEELLADTAAQVQRLCEFAQVPFGERMRALVAGELPHSRYTLTPPDPDKWRKNEKELEAVLPEVSDVAEQLSALTASIRPPPEIPAKSVTRWS